MRTRNQALSIKHGLGIKRGLRTVYIKTAQKGKIERNGQTFRLTARAYLNTQKIRTVLQSIYGVIFLAITLNKHFLNFEQSETSEHFFVLSLLSSHCRKIILSPVFGLLLGATRGARNHNIQVVITHTSHVCGLSMQSAFVQTSSKNEWTAHNAI